MDLFGGPSLGLAPITLADLPLFQQAFSRLSQPISDYSFANTLAWSRSLNLGQATIAGHRCVFAQCHGELTMLMPPLPLPQATDSDLRDSLQECFQRMDQYNAMHGGIEHSRIEYVSDEMLERIHGVCGGRFTLSASAMGGDYVYDTRAMIELAGKSYRSKRHAKSNFMRDWPDHRTDDLQDRYLPQCLALLDCWQHHGDEAHVGQQTLETHVSTEDLRHRETDACRYALDHFRVMGMKGMVVLVGDRLIGFTLGQSISPTQVSILFEKTHPDYHGVAQYIFSEFCRRYWADLPYCNAGDDWGIPSLRFTKNSYRPIRMLSKSVLTRQPMPVVSGYALKGQALAVAASVAITVGTAATLTSMP